MDIHTLTEEQSRTLAGDLESHISQDIPVGEAGPTLLKKLKRIKPYQGKWAILYTTTGEEEIFQALVNSHWPRRHSLEKVESLPISAAVEPEGFGERDFFAEAENEVENDTPNP